MLDAAIAICGAAMVKGGKVYLIDGDDYRLATDDELAKISAKAAEIEAEDQARQKKAARKMNCDYNGVSISLTSKDALGLMQVKTAFELGVAETVFVFQNGTQMSLTTEPFPALAQFFAHERNKLFVG